MLSLLLLIVITGNRRLPATRSIFYYRRPLTYQSITAGCNTQGGHPFCRFCVQGRQTIIYRFTTDAQPFPFFAGESDRKPFEIVARTPPVADRNDRSASKRAHDEPTKKEHRPRHDRAGRFPGRGQ